VGTLAALAAAGAPAQASSQTVSAETNSWSTSSVSIVPGDTVTWSNPSSFCHNIVVKDGAGTEVGRFPSASSYSSLVCALLFSRADTGLLSNENWSFFHTFTAAGTYSYYCELHSTASYGTRSGMAGLVYVASPGGSTGGSSYGGGSTGGGTGGGSYGGSTGGGTGGGSTGGGSYGGGTGGGTGGGSYGGSTGGGSTSGGSTSGRSGPGATRTGTTRRSAGHKPSKRSRHRRKRKHRKRKRHGAQRPARRSPARLHR
jgi:plastocyanin